MKTNIFTYFTYEVISYYPVSINVMALLVLVTLQRNKGNPI